MKKSILLIVFLLMFVSFAQAQKEKKIKSKRLTKEQAANMTPDQRFVYENNRKSKGKDVSIKKRVKIDMKQDRKSRKIKKTHPKRKN